jgi:hypothetical protein
MNYRILLIVLFALAPLGARAQVPPEPDDAETARRYAVEIIIFAYQTLDSVGTEIFEPPLLDDEAAGPEFGDAAAMQSVPALPEASNELSDELSDELHYRLLNKDEYGLTDTWGMLSRLEAYEPLMHFGWVQDTDPEAEARPLALERFGTPPEGLAGTVSLALGRYLHLGVDLTLAADESNPPPQLPVPDDLSGAAGPGAGDALRGARYAPLRYAIKETRIVKSGETRYYDHPHFGVIARVTRADGVEATISGRRP